MKMVKFVGSSRSGKGTRAIAPGASAGLPVRHMDHIQRLPGWRPRARSERTAVPHGMGAQDACIFEGGFSTTCDNRAARADALIWPHRETMKLCNWTPKTRHSGRARIARRVAEAGHGRDIVHLRRPAIVRKFPTAHEAAA